MKTASLKKSSSLSTSPDSYIYKILPVDSNIAAISSDDSLHVIDPTSLEDISAGILNDVHAGVTCLDTLQGNVTSLLTCGRDALARCWDMRTGKKTLEFNEGKWRKEATYASLMMEEDSKSPFLSLCHDDHCVVVGTELSHSQASVIIWDHRFPSKPMRQYVESHNDDVTEVQFHPSSKGLLLSGSTDGLVNIYNIAHSDEDDALVQVANHGSSIHHAGFLCKTKIFALSHDEIFSIYELEGQDDAAKDLHPHVFGNLRPQLECEYVVDVNQSIDGGEVILSAGSHSKQHLDLVPLRKGQNWSFDFSSITRLPGAHGEEIVRSTYINHKAQTIFTAGEDGQVKAWQATSETENVEEHMQEAEPEEKPSKRKKRNRAGSSNAKGRFKPY